MHLKVIAVDVLNESKRKLGSVSSIPDLGMVKNTYETRKDTKRKVKR